MYAMEEIRIMEKPDYVSWDEIHDVLWAGHEENRKAGLHMKYPSLPSDQLEALLRDNGCCFVALDGRKVVGTCSYRLFWRRRWYTGRQRVVSLILDAMLPEYQGRGIYSKLYHYREEHLRNLGLNLIDMDTAEGNDTIQKVFLKDGFRYVDYMVYESPHYSVVMAKWLNGCPYSRWKCWWKFHWRKWIIRFIYKPGKIKRFGR